jgi:hypothetical protein
MPVEGLLIFCLESYSGRLELVFLILSAMISFLGRVVHSGIFGASNNFFGSGILFLLVPGRVHT